MVKIALFQSNTGIDPAANAARLVDAIGQAAADGTSCLGFADLMGDPRVGPGFPFGNGRTSCPYFLFEQRIRFHLFAKGR